MSKEWHNIDDLFRRGIKDFSDAPFPDSWNAIQQKMAETSASQRKERRRHYLFAAGFSLLFLATSFFAYRELALKNSYSISDNHLKEKLVTNHQQSSGSQKAGTINKPISEISDLNTATAPEHDHLASSKISVSAPQNRTGSENFNYIMSEDQNIPVSVFRNENTHSLPLNIPTSYPDYLTKPATGNKDLSENYMALIELKQFRLLKEDHINSEIHGLPQLSTAEPPKEKRDLFTLTGYIAGEFSYRNITAVDKEGAIIAEERSSDIFKTSLSTTFLLEKKILGDLLVGAGIGYLNAGEQYYEKNYSFGRIGHLPGNTSGGPSSYSVTAYDSTLITNKYQYVTIPLTLGIEKDLGAVSFHALTGLSANYLVEAKQQQLYNKLFVDNNRLNFKNVSTPMNRFAVSSWTSMDVRVDVLNFLAVGAGPDFKYFISSGTSPSSGISYHPLQIGFHGSLSAKF